MNLSAPFVRRPIASSLAAAAILIFGIAAYLGLPVALLPNADFPTIRVLAQLPGASPETMAATVATPLERRFGRIAGVSEISSTSAPGTTIVLLQFDLNRDSDSAARDVEAAIAAARAELPPDMPARPTYRKLNPVDLPTLFLTLTSSTVPNERVYEQALTVLAPKISQIAGVSQAVVNGDAPAVRVRVNAAALSAANLTLEELRGILERSTANLPNGRLHGASFSFTIDTNHQLFGAAAFRSLVVATKDGSSVRLGDVAEVLDDVTNDQAAVRADGRPAVVIWVWKLPEANLVEMNERILALLPSLRASLPPGVELKVVFDRARIVRASVEHAEHTLLLSVALVIIVVFAFLRTWRATAVAAVALPLSLIATFGLMRALDFSLDTLSLMALTIATGFIVDDAIVVTEKTMTLLDAGATPREAACRGAAEIGFTIVAITLSLLAALIPVLLVGGIVGRLFRQFAVVLALSVTVSAVISLTLTPALAARLLERPAGDGRFAGLLQRGFDRVLRGYERSLVWVLAHRRFMLTLTVATLVATVALYIAVPKSMFPRQDSGFIVGTSEAPQDVSFLAMQQRQTKLDEIVGSDHDVEHVLSFIGAQPGGPATNIGTSYILLRAKPPRTASADEVVARLRGKVSKVEGAQLHLQASQDVRIGARTSRTQYQYTLQAAELSALRTWVPRMLEKLTKIAVLKDVSSDLQTSGLSADLEIDRDTAARLGVSVQTIDDTLYDAFGQRQVATSFSRLNYYRVVLEVEPQLANGADSLRELFVRTVDGKLASLASLAKPRTKSVPLTITHQGQFPAVTFSFNLAPNASLSDAVAAIHKTERELGLPPDLIAAFQGTAQAFEASIATQPMLALIAMIAIYVVLGVLYESFVHPLTILSTLPPATIGAVVALLVCGLDFTIIAFIGVILLVGIVKKNAILMIDAALDIERKRGLSPEAAIREGCLQRFRPIMMTTLAALCGALPLALGSATGSELRQPVGIAIVGGLIVSQLLTLYTTPVVHLALGRLRTDRRATE